MVDDPRTAYLRRVLSLDPRDAADDIIAARNAFLRPDAVIVAATVHEDTLSDRRDWLHTRLASIRRDFWQLSEEHLTQQLTWLLQSGQPEIVAPAARLGQVAQHRAAIAALIADPYAHPTFVKAFSQILVSSAAEANRLREREHGWMRPEQNLQYQAAKTSIQHTIQRIRQQHPQLFAIEEAWLSEMLQFNPSEETENHFAMAVLGAGMLLSVGFTILAMIALVLWIFL